MTPAATSAGASALRCFLALLPDAASRTMLAALRTATPTDRRHGWRWLDAASLHLTLRFLGATTATQAEQLQRRLSGVARALPVLASRRCAIWPNRARPRVLVLEIEAADALLALAGACEALARDCGFAPESRPFRAHLTLARLRPGCALGNPCAPALTLRFDTLALMASNPQTAGARYQNLATTPLPR